MTYKSTTNLYFASKGGEPVSPDFLGQRETLDCPLCHQRIVIAVRPEFVDWKSVAMEYKAFADKLSERYWQIAKDTEAMYGENPAAKYFHNEIMSLIENLKKHMRIYE